ncbi:unnamed protein product [Ceratitis capitata]|uniref:(Mediterranean fruit fly) hypothetical protein n=1 Tax=Ceratitis capitata TaxID=7213 RepID=A0A811V3P6_CERCA|nr:unnamed protein product [Ceratitis capitata]
MSETELYDSKGNSESFLQYGNEKPPPIVVVVGDGRSRVRRVVRTATRHVTVVSYSTRHKETRTHTSHHVTTVSKDDCKCALLMPYVVIIFLSNADYETLENFLG